MNNSQSASNWLLFIALAILVTLWIFWTKLFGYWLGETSPGILGQYGDTYGSLNTLFSGLAFLAVYFSLVQQSSQFREEQKTEQFYRLLETWQNGAREVTYSAAMPPDVPTDVPQSGEIVSTGSHAFCQMENDFLGTIEKRHGVFTNPGWYLGPLRQMQPLTTFTAPVEQRAAAAQFVNFYEERVGAVIGHLLRMQVELVKYADEELPKRAVRLIETYKAAVSDPELHLLLYFAISPLCDEGFRRLSRKYDIFETLARKPRRFVCHRIPELVLFLKHDPSSYQSTANVS